MEDEWMMQKGNLQLGLDLNRLVKTYIVLLLSEIHGLFMGPSCFDPAHFDFFFYGNIVTLSFLIYKTRENKNRKVKLPL
jgi:hypothetical protein